MIKYHSSNKSVGMDACKNLQENKDFLEEFNELHKMARTMISKSELGFATKYQVRFFLALFGE